MNVYLIEDDGGVTVFDAGICDMTAAVRAAGARLGGIKRVVLGHADADHRGAAPGLGAPVYCHPAERAAAESARTRAATTGTLSKLGARTAACCLNGCCRSGTAARCRSQGTVEEGDEVAGFRVVDLPGHAPGLIGLFRESDRLALVSDCFYTLDPQTGIKDAAPGAAPGVQHRHRAGARRRSASSPRSSRRRRGPGTPTRSRGDVAAQLERAASARRV